MSLDQAPMEIRWAYCRDHPRACNNDHLTITALGNGCYEVNNRIYECSYDDVPNKQLRCAPDSWAPWRWLRPTSDLSEAQLDSGLSTRIVDVSQKTVGRCASLWNERRIAACTHEAATHPRARPSVVVVDGRDPADDPSRYIAAAYFLLDASTPLEIPELAAIEVVRSGKDRLVLTAELCDEAGHLEARIRKSTHFAALDRAIVDWLSRLPTARSGDEPACTVAAVIVSKIEYTFPPRC